MVCAYRSEKSWLCSYMTLNVFPTCLKKHGVFFFWDCKKAFQQVFFCLHLNSLCWLVRSTVNTRDVPLLCSRQKFVSVLPSYLLLQVPTKNIKINMYLPITFLLLLDGAPASSTLSSVNIFSSWDFSKFFLSGWNVSSRRFVSFHEDFLLSLHTLLSPKWLCRQGSCLVSAVQPPAFSL